MYALLTLIMIIVSFVGSAFAFGEGAILGYIAGFLLTGVASITPLIVKFPLSLMFVIGAIAAMFVAVFIRFDVAAGIVIGAIMFYVSMIMLELP